MIIICQDKSRTERTFRKSRRVLSSLLFRISKRVYIGSLPRRIIGQLIRHLKINASKGSNIYIWVENKSGFMGFELVRIGPQGEENHFWDISLEFMTDLDVKYKTEHSVFSRRGRNG